MALITCPTCGKQISDRAIQCPHCGYSQNPSIACKQVLAAPVHLTRWQQTLWTLLKVAGVFSLITCIFPLIAYLGYQADDWETYWNMRSSVDSLSMILSFFVFCMAINNKAIKYTLIVLWMALTCYLAVIIINDTLISLQIQWCYRGLKLIFLGLLLYKFIKTPLLFPVIINLITAIFYLIFNYVDYDIRYDLGLVNFVGFLFIEPLILALYFLIISKSSWQKVFDSQDNSSK